MKKTILRSLVVLGFIAVFAALLSSPTATAQEEELSIELPALVLTGIEYELEVNALPSGEEQTLPYRVIDITPSAEIEIATGELSRDQPKIEAVMFGSSGPRSLTIEVGEASLSHELTALPGWLSILPPLFAIILAIAFRQVVLALLSGIWLGALFVNDYNPITASVRTVDKYIVDAIADSGHASIIAFSLLLGGMIGVITKSGGGVGLARLVTKRIRGTRDGLLGTWFLGILVFFDDYANTLLVGATMRPITDRLRVSREKLAFVVDATAAPVSSLALVSSWIGVEVGYIADQYESLGIEGDAYLVFLQTIPYRFYPLLMLFFGLLVVLMRRDFGPMRKAELRAREKGALLRKGARPAADHGDEGASIVKDEKASWIHAALPILTVVVVAVGGMVVTGWANCVADDIEPTLRGIFGNADSTKALLWSAFFGCVVAIVLVVARRAMKLADALDSWVAGMRSMVMAVTILVLAWSLGQVCRDLDTAQFVISAIGSWITPGMLPALIFVIAAAVSFATGTSWGTMAILFPLVVPLAHDLGPGDSTVMLGSISSILAGSVWGDHCSPISDTTILSSMASACDHVDHVRTQLPYALVVGVVALVVGDLAAGLGLYPAWVGLILGAGILYVVVRYVGQPVPDHDGKAPPETQ